MKRKVYYVIGAIIIVFAIAAASAFLFLTKDVEPATTDFQLDGTWRLFNCNAATEDEQYLVFDNNIVNAYKNGDSTPALTSAFEYSTKILVLSDLGLEYRLDRNTDNCLGLIIPNASSYTLVRSMGDGITRPSFDWELLIGTWDVTLHGNALVADEQMVFNGTSMLVYQDGNTTPYLDSSYTTKENGILVADSIGLELNLCYLDAELAILVETQTGYAFELVRQK